MACLAKLGFSWYSKFFKITQPFNSLDNKLFGHTKVKGMCQEKTGIRLFILDYNNYVK